jgi:hypothetical protein
MQLVQHPPPHSIKFEVRVNHECDRAAQPTSALAQSAPQPPVGGTKKKPMCPTCGIIFPSRCKFRYHQRQRNHCYCSICKQYFETPSDFSKHNHDRKDPTFPLVCLELVKSKRPWSTRFECYCGENFNTREALLAHLAAVVHERHGDNYISSGNVDGPARCPVCQKTFKTFQGAEHHMRDLGHIGKAIPEGDGLSGEQCLGGSLNNLPAVPINIIPSCQGESATGADSGSIASIKSEPTQCSETAVADDDDPQLVSSEESSRPSSPEGGVRLDYSSSEDEVVYKQAKPSHLSRVNHRTRAQWAAPKPHDSTPSAATGTGTVGLLGLQSHRAAFVRGSSPFESLAQLAAMSNDSNHNQARFGK